jgi:hypothetical protein
LLGREPARTLGRPGIAIANLWRARPVGRRVLLSFAERRTMADRRSGF